MKVLVVGFPKTGTTSLAEALRILGYKVYDFEEHFLYLGEQWKKVFTEGATAEDFYEMYKDVDASTDVPACMFWEEIMEAFPDVKLILTRRKSQEEWWRSWINQVGVINRKSTIIRVLSILSPTMRAFTLHNEYMKHLIFSGRPRKHFLDDYIGFSPTVSKMRYREHNASVVARAPKGKLLEFDLADGWEPLCKFLGKSEVPQVPFPRANVAGALIEKTINEQPLFVKIGSEAKVSAAVIAVVVAVVVYTFLYCF